MQRSKPTRASSYSTQKAERSLHSSAIRGHLSRDDDPRLLRVARALYCVCVIDVIVALGIVALHLFLFLGR